MACMFQDKLLKLIVELIALEKMKTTSFDCPESRQRQEY